MRIIRLCVSLVISFAALVIAPLPSRAAPAGTGGRIAFSFGIQLPGDDLGHHSDVWTVRPDGSDRRQLTHVPANKVAALPSFSRDGRRIAYQSNVSGENQIWAMDADGSHQAEVRHDPGYEDLSPSWSPNGRRIVFSRCDKPFGYVASCAIAVMNADGTGLRNLVNDHRIHVKPKFSPDGRRIVFASDRAGLLSAIWVVRSNGTGLRRITSANVEGFFPDWSPDGRHILFADNCCRPHSNLWTVRPNGAGLKRLTDAPANGNYAFGSYSPGGRRVVFFDDHDLIVRSASGRQRSIVTNAPEGILASWGPDAHARQSEAHPVPAGAPATPVTAAADPVLASASGTDTGGSARNGRIAFRDYKTGQLYTVNPDGTALVQVTHLNAAYQARQPEWSPDGRKIAFSMVRANVVDDNARIWIMNADGSGSHQLVDDAPGYRDYQPNFTPDARHIVFSRCQPDNGVCAIWSMRSDGSHMRALTPYRTEPNEAVDFSLDVSPDGQHVAFARFGWKGIAVRIFEIRIDGNDEHPVSPAWIEASRPTYTPDGKRISVSGETFHLGGQIYALRTNGSHVKALTHTPYPYYNLGSSYAPAGDRVAFSSDRGHTTDCCFDLYVANADGRGQHRVPTGGLSGVIDVAWGTARRLPATASTLLRTPSSQRASAASGSTIGARCASRPLYPMGAACR